VDNPAEVKVADLVRVAAGVAGPPAAVKAAEAKAVVLLVGAAEKVAAQGPVPAAAAVGHPADSKVDKVETVVAAPPVGAEAVVLVPAAAAIRLAAVAVAEEASEAVRVVVVDPAEVAVVLAAGAEDPAEVDPVAAIKAAVEVASVAVKFIRFTSPKQIWSRRLTSACLQIRSPGRASRAVTLLELILALALSVLVLSAVGMAINLYFKMLDVRRTSMEEMQVVRIVTQRITNDLRMMVQPNQPDLSGLETAMNNAMQAAMQQTAAASGVASTVIGGAATGTAAGGAAGGNTGGGGQGAAGQGAGGQGGTGQGGSGQGGSGGQGGAGAQGGGQGGGGAQGTGGGPAAGGGQAAGTGGAGAAGAASGGSSGATSGSSTGSATSASGSTSTSATGTTAEAAAPVIVKLLGSATELQFDISRLPRVDQFNQSGGLVQHSGQTSTVDLPSDVKTVVYFIRSTQSAQSYVDDPRATGGEASTDGYGRGLMRAEMDRAVTLYSDSGTGDSAYSVAQLLANEVVGLGFEYFDGTDFLTEWDSSSSGTLPRAIRVWLSVQPLYGMTEEELQSAQAGKKVEPTDFYFVISLPTVPAVTATATESTDTSSSSSSSSTSGTSTGTAAGTTP
jgi:hypothetical protein